MQKEYPDEKSFHSEGSFSVLLLLSLFRIAPERARVLGQLTASNESLFGMSTKMDCGRKASLPAAEDYSPAEVLILSTNDAHLGLLETA